MTISIAQIHLTEYKLLPLKTYEQQVIWVQIEIELNCKVHHLKRGMMLARFKMPLKVMLQLFLMFDSLSSKITSLKYKI